MAATAQVIELNCNRFTGNSHQFKDDDDFVRAFLRSQRSQKTTESYEKAIREFRLFCCQKKDISEVVISDIQDWLEWLIRKGLRAASVNLKLSAIKSLFQFGFKSRYLSGIDPTEYARCLPTQQKQEGKALTVEELKNLIIQVKKESRKKQIMILFMLGTGCRVSGMLNLQNKHLNPLSDDPKYAGTAAIKNKGGKIESLPIIKSVWELIYDPAADHEGFVLSSRITGGRISDVYINATLKIIAKKAGITRKITTHSLRHTALSMMFANGADIETVKKAAMHSSIRTTQRYLHTPYAGVGEYMESLLTL